MAEWNKLTMTVLGDVLEERGRQDDQWGEQNHPSFPANMDRAGYRKFHREQADMWKQVNGNRVGLDSLSWDGIALEEIEESLAEDDGPELYAELIQAAAVFANWAECLRRAGHGPADPRTDDAGLLVITRAKMAIDAGGDAAPLVNGMRHCLASIPGPAGPATCTRHSGHLGIHYDFVLGVSWHQAVDPETPGVC